MTKEEMPQAFREAKRIRDEGWPDEFTPKTETPTMTNPAEALRRAEMKLSAYVGVCKGDKELTDTVLPMVREALAALATPSPPPDEGVPKLTREELAALFGPTMPMDVAMFVSCTDKPLIEVRKEVYRHALALASPVPPDVIGVVERLEVWLQEHLLEWKHRAYPDLGIKDRTFIRQIATLLLSLASERDGLETALLKGMDGDLQQCMANYRAIRRSVQDRRRARSLTSKAST